jgi:hypothetical protein
VDDRLIPIGRAYVPNMPADDRAFRAQCDTICHKMNRNIDDRSREVSYECCNWFDVQSIWYKSGIETVFRLKTNNDGWYCKN